MTNKQNKLDDTKQLASPPVSLLDGSPIRASLLRWLDIFFLSVVVFVICLIFHLLFPAITKHAAAMYEQIVMLIDGPNNTNAFPGSYTHGNLIGLFILVVIVSAATVPLSIYGVLRLGHFKRLMVLRYPPLWIAAIIPLCSIFKWMHHEVWSNIKLISPDAIVLMVTPLLTIITMWLFKKKRRSPMPPNQESFPTQEETLKNFKENPSKLLAWLEDDTPIGYPSQDLFDAKEYAKHMAELITAKQLGGIALIGQRGAGKSSVLNLVDYYLHKDKTFKKGYRLRWGQENKKKRNRMSPPKIFTCRVSAWGFVDESAAIVVLRAIIGELSNHVDCLAVRNLPGQYMASVKDAMPSWANTLFAVTSLGDPEKQLKQLSPILEAINARLVVYIEDLDRNFPDEEQRNRVAMKVESLLDRMKKIERLSFVVAADRSGELDLMRLAEHHVEIFGLDINFAWPVIQLFAQHCLDFSKIKNDEIVMLPHVIKKDKDFEILQLVARRGYMSWEEGLCRLLRLPRTLKHALYNAWIAWERLHGEVSLDDLLAYNTIRTASPEKTGIIHDDWIYLTSDAKVTNQTKNKEKQPAGNLLSQLKKSDPAQCIDSLLALLFPQAYSDYRWKKPQGADSERYWKRIINGKFESNPIYDQKIIKSVKAKNIVDIVSGFLKDGNTYPSVFVELFEQKVLHDELLASDILQISSTFFSKLLTSCGADAKLSDHPASWDILKMLCSRKKAITEYETWLLEQIKIAMPISLLFACELERYWATSDLLTDADMDSIRREITAYFKTNINADKLCRTLSNKTDMAQALHWILQGMSSPQVKRALNHNWIQDAAEMGQVLISAAMQSPLPVIPEIVGLFAACPVIDLSGGTRKIEGITDINIFKQIFPTAELQKQVVALIVKTYDGESVWHQNVQIMVSQARNCLRELQKGDPALR